MGDLTIDDIYVGSIIRVQLNNKFEGYGRLVETAGEAFGVIEKETDPVRIRQRWLIEWVGLDEVEMTKEERMTQSFLVGLRQHRYIEFEGGIHWEEYVKEHTDSNSGQQPGYDKPLDNFMGF